MYSGEEHSNQRKLQLQRSCELGAFLRKSKEVSITGMEWARGQVAADGSQTESQMFNSGVLKLTLDREQIIIHKRTLN